MRTRTIITHVCETCGNDYRDEGAAHLHEAVCATRMDLYEAASTGSSLPLAARHVAELAAKLTDSALAALLDVLTVDPTDPM